LADCAQATAAQLSKDRRTHLLNVLKTLTLHITATRPIKEATVTRGGVDTRDVDPTTMQSRLCPRLYFAGEVLNVDGPCGGYNLQIAFSTGYLAGISVSCHTRDAESEP
jgi:predicted flavoprotein YhiN